jgi:5-methylcytosine-specific restriction endonuclease McrA
MKPDLRRRVERRAKGRCEYCQLPLRRDPLTHHIDHVVATQHGGLTRSDNLAVTCSRGSQRVNFRAKLLLEGLYDEFLSDGPA